jgi:hypothetical protein
MRPPEIRPRSAEGLSESFCPRLRSDPASPALNRFAPGKLQPKVQLPIGCEVVFIAEAFAGMQTETGKRPPSGIFPEGNAAQVRDPIGRAMDPEAVQVFVAPSEGTLKDCMEFGEAGVAGEEQSPPHQRAHAAEHDAKLIVAGDDALTSLPVAASIGKFRLIRPQPSAFSSSPSKLVLLAAAGGEALRRASPCQKRLERRAPHCGG